MNDTAHEHAADCPATESQRTLAHHHTPGAKRDAPTVGSTAALANVRTVLPENPHYRLIGGEAGIRALVLRFYHYMDTLPEAQTIRAMHAGDLAPMQEVLFRFLSGWLGGPPLYAAQAGQPRLRRAHLPFVIGNAERDAWMDCMTLALADVVTDSELRRQLTEAFLKTANFLRNAAS